MNHMQATIAVIGGGASGLVAAIEAKKRLSSHDTVVIIEQNSRVGKKILASGNGRCNFGNLDITVSHYHSSIQNLSEILMGYPGASAYFHELGVLCREEFGRLYPYSNHASAILDALRLSAQSLAITTLLETKVLQLEVQDKTIILFCSNQLKIEVSAVIYAAGGCAAPTLGTDGSSYRLLEQVGHHILPLTPALSPIYTDSTLLHGLKGIRAHAKVSAIDQNGKSLQQEVGEIQFTEKALSGVCVFNLSGLCQEKNTPVQWISLDLLPDYSQDQVELLLWEVYAIRTQQTLENFLTGLFQKRLAVQLIRQSRIPHKLTDFIYHCTQQDIQTLAKQIKDWRFPITGIAPWNQAQVSAGGVPGYEVTDTLESKFLPNLWIVGEALDVYGVCGGYNLNWAWASGYCAAEAAAKKIKEEASL